MALVINSNMASLATQRALTETQKDSATSLERLSSGLRINSAKDDAAGLAIANRFTAQINGLSAAMRNVNDGISMLQVGEGAMEEITSNLQRMRELAVQASNGTNATTDLTALDAEYQQLEDEIQRVASGTTFNGVALFDGNNAGVAVQVGADNATSATTNQMTIGTTAFIDATTGTIGTSTATQGITADNDGTLADSQQTDLATGALEINGTNIGAVSLGGDAGSYAANLATAINGAQTFVTAEVTGASTLSTGIFTGMTFAAATDGYSLDINGVNIVTADTGATTTLSQTNFDLALDSQQSALAALGITYTGSAAAGFTFTRTDGGNINFAETTVGAANGVANGFANTDLDLTAAGDTATISGYGVVTLSSDNEFVIGGTASTTAGFTAGTQSASNAATGSVLNTTDVTTATTAQTALTAIDDALNTINAARANSGAMLSRLDSVSASLANTVENYTSARSRVQDADFAVESANLARTQVLQQAGISVLAQANALPQQVLALLQ